MLYCKGLTLSAHSGPVFGYDAVFWCPLPAQCLSLPDRVCQSDPFSLIQNEAGGHAVPGGRSNRPSIAMRVTQLAGYVLGSHANVLPNDGRTQIWRTYNLW
jgi:hypothetical protein